MNLIEPAKRFGHVFADGSTRLRTLLRDAKGGEVRPKALEDCLTGWGKSALRIMKLDLHVSGKPSETPVLFVGNHISYLDIPVLMSQASIMFVAKREVGRWPVFGTAVRKLGMVMVDRNSSGSRQRAQEAVADCILKKRRHVAIFPSGTTRLYEEIPWRWGAFQIAQEYGIKIQPFRLRYEPARAVAYLMDDVFVPHLWRLLGHEKLSGWLEFHEPVAVKDPEKECKQWWEWSRATETVIARSETTKQSQ